MFETGRELCFRERSLLPHSITFRVRACVRACVCVHKYMYEQMKHTHTQAHTHTHTHTFRYEGHWCKINYRMMSEKRTVTKNLQQGLIVTITTS